MPPGIVLAPTVTKLPDAARGAVLLTGSHGGRYAGRCALIGGVRAAVFHDAGIGRDAAGIGALAMFEALGVPAVGVSHVSARIGDAADMLARGRISAANRQAVALGVAPGQDCRDALACLARCEVVAVAAMPAATEARTEIALPGAARRIVLVDSASLVTAADAGAVVVTASHGGLVGGDPAMALRTEAFAGLFNDAGVGIERAGLGRLAALDARGIAATTVAAASARIGEARSTFEDGVISAVNATAAARGVAVGTRARDAVEAWARAG
jgi:uncharacterized protein YunC (DUF1805 family)